MIVTNQIRYIFRVNLVNIKINLTYFFLSKTLDLAFEI